MKKRMLSGLLAVWVLLAWAIPARASNPGTGGAAASSGMREAAPPFMLSDSSDLFWNLEEMNPETAVTVSYNANGGGGAMESTRMEAGTFYALPVCGFTPPDGMRFQAWRINGVDYDAGDLYQFNADTAVAAVWETADRLVVTVDSSEVPGTGYLGERYDGWFVVNPSSELRSLRFSLTEGELPQGLTLESDGYISGTVEATGEYTFQVGVFRNDGSCAAETECTIFIKMQEVEFTSQVGTGLDRIQRSGGDGTDPTPPDNNTDTDVKPIQADEDPGKSTTPDSPHSNSAAQVFSDISGAEWFFSDLNWAYGNKIISGYSDGTFKPSIEISGAMSVVVLARMGSVNPDSYKSRDVSGIPAGKWYTNEARWAKLNGILPFTSFAGRAYLERGQMALLLVNYLKYMGIKVSAPVNKVNFADADQMTGSENEALQILYRLGIFNGRGNRIMDPRGHTTRAHLVALLNRMNTFIEAHSGQ